MTKLGKVTFFHCSFYVNSFCRNAHNISSRCMNSIQNLSSLFHILFPFNNILTRSQRFEIQTFFAKKIHLLSETHLHFSNEIHPLSLFLHRNPPTRRQILGWGNLQWAEGRRKVKTIFLAKQKKIQPKDNVSTRVIIIDPVRGSLCVQSYLAISIVWGYWGRFEHPPSVWNFRCAECVAIGECGLDFNRNFSPPEVQIEVFEKQVILIWMMIRNIIKIMLIMIMIKDNIDDDQVLLACELGKPLFLHERDAHPEMVSILERWSS